MPLNMSGELLTIGDCITYIAEHHHQKISQTAVRLWIRQGRLPAHRTRGGMSIVRLDDLKRLLADRARHRRGFRAGARVLPLEREE
jgi:predicted site-specific integrase-resolvase